MRTPVMTLLTTVAVSVIGTWAMGIAARSERAVHVSIQMAAAKPAAGTQAGDRFADVGSVGGVDGRA
jgi:hypothetical protein